MVPMDTRTCSDMSESKKEKEEGFEFGSAKKKRVEFVCGPRQAGCGGDCCGSDGVAASLRCQAQGCEVDLTEAKRYYRRHKVCEVHAKAVAVIVAGLRQRFCQQCSRFHELSKFDDTKRSCRRRLAGHNERRRKSSNESPGEGSSAHQRPGVIFLNQNYRGQNGEENAENRYYKHLHLH